MEALASEGILCVLVEMPFRLAVLDMNAADGIPAAFPEVEHWYLGGHSLGGSMAASYLASHTEDFDGLILLGSYSTADLSGSGLSVLSVYGSEDGVLNRDKYAEYKPNLPEGFTETVIAGGNHAYFGAYGEQEGDGVATVTPAEQLRQTAEAMLAMMEVAYED
jgi:dienelactone hydrolase